MIAMDLDVYYPHFLSTTMLAVRGAYGNCKVIMYTVLI